MYPKLILPTPTNQPSRPPVLPFDEVQKIDYLIACIREAQRMVSPTGNLTPRMVSEPGLTLDGMYIPPGAEIGQNPWVLGRCDTFYGDPDVYRPERWLESPERTRELEKGESTWGFGPRSCIGRNLAMLELYKCTWAGDFRLLVGTFRRLNYK